MLKIQSIYHYSVELEALRSICFPGPENNNKDLFNERSAFLVVHIDGVLAVSGRFTPNPGGPFITQSFGKGAFRNEADTVDFGRVMVAPAFRGGVLYDYLILKGLQWAFEQGYAYVNGSVRTGRMMLGRLQQLHFKMSGPVVENVSPYNERHLVQPLICDLISEIESIKGHLQSLSLH